MKISKIFGFVLGIHLVLIAALVVQPGCRMQPPSYNYLQSDYDQPIASQSANTDAYISNGQTDPLLDPAFNSGLGVGEYEPFTPTRPEEEFIEFEEITPKLTPVLPEPAGPEIAVMGPSFETHTVQKGDNLWAISRRYNCSLNDLYAANGLNKSSVLKVGQQIQIPVEGGTGTPSMVTADTYQPSGFNVTTRTHVVKAGDTLSRIALKYDTTLSVIKAANNKTSDLIRVGEKLLIPVNGATGTNSTAPTVSQPYVSSASSASAADKASGIHIVKAGEYPAVIARKYDMTTADLLAINSINDPRKIQVGQRLKVSSSAGVSKTQPEAKVVPALPTIEPVKVEKPKATVSVKETNAPVEIRVLEADPLIESEEPEMDPADTEAIFEDAVEIPVIRIEE